MDGNRVSSLVDGLTSTFEAGLAFYTKWKQKQERENHYQRSPRKVSPADSKCALGTSLDLSTHRIKTTYQVGFALIGPEFAVGDTLCRDCLWASLSQLQDCVNLLRQSVLSTRPGPLNLYDMIHVSEATRTRCIVALAEQYRRLASGRAIPQDLPIPNLRPSLRQQEHQERPTKAPSTHSRDQPIEFDRQTADWSTSSGPPVFQSEPPSPPLTPRLQPNDAAHSPLGSTLGGPSDTAGNPRSARGPNNSVFSMFCPEAMALQVDPARPVPSGRCSGCGYRCDAATTPQAVPLLLKDGFRLTPRFLAKSHCGGGGTQGYGCVLCTSSGRAETYDTAEVLRVHVNAAHTKWQMLHDRDMA
ncbi:hypothetical protein CONLIGDRAFT_717683 [Coniochaeta ligniaria NRRL 30616]|uniref:Uncharacterized protein n=1 Tax=Coniochaeta ligniaria NRRL 30616 TaxID=1408157 RepID=A0A1J7IFI4_9PEZI|nr:hypothetical protein CONLIGDRAFT_717683 [Coniochaeta ligniaria NRRL 30616]